MRKFLILTLIVLLSILIGGLYGILNDQFTFTISPEYYTRFKFYQFGLVDFGNEAILSNPRIMVSVVGFMATWWMGLLLGLILGLIGLVHKDSTQMFRVTMKAISLTVIAVIATGLIGLAYGSFYLAGKEVNWLLPDNLIDVKSFISVGSMHNFSYLGGVIGLIVGVTYSIKQKQKNLITEIDKKNDSR